MHVVVWLGNHIDVVIKHNFVINQNFEENLELMLREQIM